MDDRMINECGSVCGMRIVRGNRNTQRKPTPVPLYPSHLNCSIDI
jgi:hypothetical protein